MYTHFYSFSEEPFRDSPDPRFLFLTPSHQRTLGSLIQGIEEKSGWLILTGEPGTGKTVLIHHLLEFLKGKPGIKSAFIFQTRNSLEDLLKEILSELNLPPGPPTGVPITEHFKRSIAQTLSPVETFVIFLDEAQDFSVEMLEKISNFFDDEYQHPGQLQIILSGQSQLEEKLRSRVLHHLNQRIRIRCLIKPLTAQESQRYIDHRLHLVAGNPDIISPEALRLIIRYGEGIPRTINIICDNALRIGHQLSESNISAEIVTKALRETYIQTSESRFPGKPAKAKSLFKKTIYSLAAITVLFLVILFAREYSRWSKGSVNPKAEVRPAQFENEEPIQPSQKSEEMPPQKKEAEPIPSAKHILSEPGAKTPPLRLTPPKEFKIAKRVKKVISVKKGRTLSNLCLEHYGFATLTLLDHIMVLNQEITNPSFLHAGQKIKLPDINDECLIQEITDGKVQVFLGTFSHPDFAGMFREEALLSGKEIKIASRKIEGGETWYRFSAGVFANKEEALKIVRALKEKRILPSFGNLRQ